MNTILTRALALPIVVFAINASAETVTFGDSKNGAAISGDFTSTLTGTQWTAALSGKAEATVFGKGINIASGDASLAVTKGQGRSKVKVNLKAVGKTLVSIDQYVNNSGTFRTANFYAAEAGGKVPFKLGPFHLKLEGRAEMQAYCDGFTNIQWAANHPPLVEASFGPVLDAAAYAGFEAGFVVGSVSINGNLKLTGYGVHANVKLQPRTGGGQNQADVTWSATFDRQATDGSVKLKARVLGIPIKKTLYSYSGGPSSTPLGAGTLRIN